MKRQNPRLAYWLVGGLIETKTMMKKSSDIRERLTGTWNHPGALDDAVQAVKDRNHSEFNMTAGGSHEALEHVVSNREVLMEHRMFEACFLDALVGHNVNVMGYTPAYIAEILTACDRERLLAAGAPLNLAFPLTVYRGFSGTGLRRVPKSYSWSLSIEVACWFALSRGAANPAVARAKLATADDVYAYISERHEDEIIAMPGSHRLMKMAPEEMKRLADTHSARIQAANDAVMLELSQSFRRP